MHEAAPSSLNLPLAHRSHETPMDACVPAAHGWHSVAPAGLMRPAGHVELHEAAPAALNVPASHAWQVLSSSYLPAGQESQEASPMADS